MPAAGSREIVNVDVGIGVYVKLYDDNTTLIEFARLDRRGRDGHERHWRFNPNTGFVETGDFKYGGWTTMSNPVQEAYRKWLAAEIAT
jgi:hypothetical protein